MDDATVHHDIDALANEEHELRAKEADGTATDADRARVRVIEVALDRAWDLLRQRRARRENGGDPDGATVRPEGTVEGYLQ